MNQTWTIRCATLALPLTLMVSASACAGSQTSTPASTLSGALLTALPAGVPPVRVTTPVYELYAPTDSAARIVSAELDFAATTFRRFFGEAPPPLAVVVFPSAEAMQTFDWSTFRQRGLRPMPWLVGIGGDMSRSRVGLEGARALSHEACHLFLIAQTGRKLGRTVDRPAGAPHTYGDPALPDWFDEGVATLCESPALQGQRREQLRRVSDNTIPFAEFFRMEHPAYLQLNALLKAQRAATGTDSASKPTGQISVQELRIPAGAIPRVDAERNVTFYSQALSVLEFLAEREGAQFVGRLGEGLGRGQTVEQLLGAHARNLPHDLSGLEREWKAWLAAKQ